MTGRDLAGFRKWFSNYVRSFVFDDEKDRKNIRLKELHTLNVCRDIVLIAKDAGLKGNDLFLAETVALFHDVGRFPQYQRHRTFRDSLSVNHGELGADVLGEKGVLGDLAAREREIILQTVKFHNAYRIPDKVLPDAAPFLRLVRDADKLDIWRVFIEYYESPPEERASAVMLDAPDKPGYSEEVLSCFYERRMASLAMVKVLNDYRLLQLTWIYDLHFDASLKAVLERDYINRLAVYLPDGEDIGKALLFLRKDIQRRLEGTQV